jgi:hypothetical protein
VRGTSILLGQHIVDNELLMFPVMLMGAMILPVCLKTKGKQKSRNLIIRQVILLHIINA